MLEAAVSEFAATGYHGTPTDVIARRAGISQPYLFRLYGTKKELFLACLERCFDRTLDTFRRAAEAGGDDRLGAMGGAYVELLADRDLLLFQLQTYAACADDDIRTAAQRRYEELTDVVAELSGAGRRGVLPFVGQGMLLNVATALGLPPEEWVWTRDE